MTADPSSPELAPSTPASSEIAWRRVHPITPLLRSWQMVVFAGVAVFNMMGRDWISNGNAPHLPQGQVPTRVWAIGIALALAVFLLMVGLAWLSWRMTRYRITATAVEMHSGVVFRQHRLAQLDRLQAVDVVQPLLARIVGLTRLTIEVAGGGKSAFVLAYLREDQAQQLRQEILARSAGLEFTGESAPAAPEHYAFEVPLQRLIGSILLSTNTAAVVFLAGATTVAALFTQSLAPLLAIGPMALGAVGVMWNRFTMGFGFRVAISADGLRLRHGLLEQRSQTVPPGRVQAIELFQPWLWRRAGWWRLEVNVAGYGGAATSQDKNTETILLPVGSRQDVLGVLSYVVPDLGVNADDDPVAVVDAALLGSGSAAGFVTSPPSARWVDWLSWRRNGFRVTSTVLLIRKGRLYRRVVVVPHARTQSLEVVQGPVQRSLGLATLAVHSTPGPIRPGVVHLAVPVAAALLRDQSERARQARAMAGPEQWMRQRLPGSSQALQQPPEVAQSTPADQFGLGADPL